MLVEFQRVFHRRSVLALSPLDGNFDPETHLTVSEQLVSKVYAENRQCLILQGLHSFPSFSALTVHTKPRPIVGPPR